MPVTGDCLLSLAPPVVRGLARGPRLGPPTPLVGRSHPGQSHPADEARVGAAASALGDLTHGRDRGSCWRRAGS